ncbi:MAG: family 20 glycosylhydrolase [Parabacteroides merdae]
MGMKSSKGGLAPSATVMSWRGEEGGIAAANMGHEAIMTQEAVACTLTNSKVIRRSNRFLSAVTIRYQECMHTIRLPDTLVATGKADLIRGFNKQNLWSEYMYNTDLLEYRAYPRVLALAEIGWTPLARKDYKDFERRLDNALVRLDELNINYHIPQPEQPNGSCDFVAFTDKASLEFKTTRPVKVVYTIDGTEPTPESTAYSARSNSRNPAF